MAFDFYNLIWSKIQKLKLFCKIIFCHLCFVKIVISRGAESGFKAWKIV